MAKPMPVAPEYLRANVAGKPFGVDRDAKMIRGYVVAQLGPFKSEGRGEFDVKSLQSIVALGNEAAKGLKVRFAHPDMSNDGIGKFLGRANNFVMDKAKDARTGKLVPAVRGDLHFSDSAFHTPTGDLATYVMDLAASDADALSSSLVLKANEEFRREKDGTFTLGPDGEPLPPLWRPTELHASDIVDTGDAVDGLLSAGQVPWASLWQGASLLDAIFLGQSRDVIHARCLMWLDRYLQRKFGPPPPPPTTPRLDARRARLDELRAMSTNRA